MQLAEIFQKVTEENARSHAKYGKWSEIHPCDQSKAIRGEYAEWYQAFAQGDENGEHGEITEAVHTINVLCRRIMFLTGEENA